MKNENIIGPVAGESVVCGDLLISSHHIVYIEVYHDYPHLDADGVLRIYEQCESIDEGLLG